MRKTLTMVLLLTLVGFVAGCGGPEPSSSSNESANQEQALEEAQRELTEARQEAEEARQEAEEVSEEAESGESSNRESPGSGEDVDPQLSPSETLGLQYRFLNTGQYEEAYDLFTEQSQRLVSRELYSGFFAPTYEVSEYSVKSEQIDGDEATVQANLVVTGTRQGTQRYPVTQDFVFEAGEWRVSMREAQLETFTGGQESEQEPSRESEQPDGNSGGSGVTVRVTGSGAFSGNYGTLDSSRSVDGVAPAEYEVEDIDTGAFSFDSVSAVMQKSGAGSGELGVQIIVDGEVVEESYTSAEYGVVQIGWTPSE